MRTLLRIPSHYVITKARDALMSRLEDQCSHGCPQHCNPVPATLFFEFAVDLRSRNYHFRQKSRYPVDSLAAMFEQVGLMGFPHVHDAKAAVYATMNTYTQVDLPTRQAEFRHIGNRAKAKTAIWVRD